MARTRRAMSQINVVPYIDVMLVLLVIFMVAAPLMPTGTVDLPSVGKASTPPSQPLEVIVKGDQSLAFVDRASKAPERVVSEAELAAAIAEARAKDPERPVLIAGDKTVRYEAVLKVMDQLQRLKVQRIGLLVHPDAK